MQEIQNQLALVAIKMFGFVNLLQDFQFCQGDVQESA